jgi:hypothetical protein
MSIFKHKTENFLILICEFTVTLNFIHIFHQLPSSVLINHKIKYFNFRSAIEKVLD